MNSHPQFRIFRQWTDKRIELLTKLWADGLSASRIAAELGGVTRNAVIGKVSRLGLSGRASRAPRSTKSCAPSAKPARRSRHNMTRLLAAANGHDPGLADPAAEAVPFAQRRTILQLTADSCRWPIGDPGRPDFFFCGGNTVPSLPYCAYHARLAYVPVSDRRREHRSFRD